MCLKKELKVLVMGFYYHKTIVCIARIFNKTSIKYFLILVLLKFGCLDFTVALDVLVSESI